jgi:Fungal chitosanase of glycosyl hydrolase group 75
MRIAEYSLSLAVGIVAAGALCLLSGCPGPSFSTPTPSPTQTPSTTPSESPSSTPTPTEPPTPTPTATPSQTPSPTATPTPSPTPSPTPTPLPETYIPYSHKDTAKLFNGIQLHSEIKSKPGDPAWKERKDESSYTLNLELDVRIPRAAESLADLVEADSSLETVLPQLATLLGANRVSPYYHALYQNKLTALSGHLNHLEQLLSRHNFFDCNTVLELTNPTTKRRALLIQSDMDVNADGSDSDRTLEVDGSSTNFQPYTSYRWAKRTGTPSQFVAEREAKIRQAQAELTEKISPERKRFLQDEIARLSHEIEDLEHYSFLVAKEDPYVVLPGFMCRQGVHGLFPRLGDLVVVIYGGKLYPAILGDVGPSDKIGEASLRLATQIDPRANPYNRPETDLNVTYLVFPGTADKDPAPPDLQNLHDRCDELLKSLGGYSGELYTWTNLLATPTPSPTPEPSPSPSESVTPAGSVSPSETPPPGGSPPPSGSATPSASVTPTGTPGASAEGSATPSLTPTPEPSSSPEKRPTPKSRTKPGKKTRNS